ncbi:hypothetical protein [Sphingomonas sp. Root710]|uniref:hypothetical protein n=1 Tax=Sphingomonas sp. Root710 TaxID=1736594 RepID=UPI000B0585F3|nr:hypothetical protein [Sphingomonas sp. Root710]
MVLSVLAVLCILAPTSHPLHGLLNWDIKYVYVASFVGLLAICFIGEREQTHSYRPLAIALLYFAFGILGTIISGAYHQIMIGIVGSASVIAVYYSRRYIYSEQAVRALNIITFCILAGAWIALIYALLGGGAIFAAMNLETDKEMPFYLTSFTNSVQDGLIRPSGIFDEPGALAMFSIIVAIINDIYGKNSSKTQLILLANLVTLSVMAFIALVIFWTSAFFVRGKRFVAFAVAFLATIALLAIPTARDIFSETVLSRFRMEDGKFAGDNRSNQLENFFYYLDWNIIKKGYLTSYGRFDLDMSSNPFSILFASGIFVWIPYFLICCMLLFLCFKNRKIGWAIPLTLLILILQRPYIYSLYWSFMLSVALMPVLFAETLSARRRMQN